jgi:hypothetical protein
MAHSAKANERRRAAYAEARRAGIPRRRSGHIYSSKGLTRALAEPVAAPLVKEGSIAERQAAFAERLSKRLGREISVERSKSYYRVHNYGLINTKATLILQESDGSKKQSSITLVSSEPLTYQEARQRIATYVEQGRSGRYDDAFIGVTFEAVVQYPDTGF